MMIRALTAVLFAAGLVSTTAPTQAQDPEKYVALGDSYSAGSGIWPLDPSITPLCARTTNNYPHMIAGTTGMQLTDMTCGGAQTKDFTTSQYPGLTRPQFDAVSADTDVITLTIGGNDATVFIGAIAACGTAGLATFGWGHPCQTIYGDTFDDKIENVVAPAVKAALADLRSRAPQADIAIIGYPWILPPANGCFLKMPIAAGDVPYVRNIQAHLNNVIAQSADEVGVTFVDMAAASEGHDACQAAGTRWVEPAVWGTNFVPVHPNALGESQMANRTMAELNLG